MRLAVFAHIRQRLKLRDALTASDLKPGFQFGGVRIQLINPADGKLTVIEGQNRMNVYNIQRRETIS